MAEKTLAQQFADAKLLAEQLRDRRARAETTLGALRATLEEASTEALLEFNTSNVAELRILYETKCKLNNDLMLEFVEQTTVANAQMADVERQMAS